MSEAVNCWCHTCTRDKAWPFALKMIVCPDCGNKRCPKATDHRLACTNSNEPGQAGSRYQTPHFQSATTKRG